MKNVAWLALLSFLESLQLIIIIALSFSFIPIPFDDFYYTFFPFMQKGVLQKRDIFFYDTFIVTAIVLQAVLLFAYRKFLNDEQRMSKARAWIVMSSIFIFFQLFLIYQVWLGNSFQLAREIFCAVCALAVVVRVFWVEIYQWMRGIIEGRGIMFQLPDSNILKIIWQRHQDTVAIFALSFALCIQAYLFVVALYGQYVRRALWPSSHSWNYIILLVSCLVVSITAVLICRRLGILTGFIKRCATWVIVEGLLAFFLLNALFKMHVYYYQPQLAQQVYVILLIVAFLVKIGWAWLERFLHKIYGVMIHDCHQSVLKMTFNALFIVFIFLFLYVPDLEAAIARIFMGEQFHGVDVALMNTGWAYHTGCRLNVDINNRYGLGWAVIVSKLTDLLGGFTYFNVYTIVILTCIVYFIAAYGLLRWWLKSVPLAIAGILLCLKMEPFKQETASVYFTSPSLTVCRYFFDIPFLFITLLFLRTLKKRYLSLAGLICAIALFYEADTGIYLTLTYYVLLMLVTIFKDTRVQIYKGISDIRFLLVWLLIPPIGALGLLYLTQGSVVFSSQFWQNMTHYARSYMWNGPIQMWEMLRGHQAWAFSLAMWVIVVYVLTLIYIGSLVFLRKRNHEYLFVLVVCIYGLTIYHYFVLRSVPDTMYKTIIPYVFILCFWVNIFTKRLSALVRRKFYMVFVGVCLYALWTTHLTIAYPNAFNFSRNPAVDPLVAVKQAEGRLGYFNFLFIEYPDAFKLAKNNLGETFEDWRTEDDFKTDKQLKEYFRREFDFSQDAALIAGLTKPDEPVALISSFEIKMLMQANRKPFFYIFPLVNSRPMRMRLFEVLHTWTIPELQDTLKQLELKKPAYVFMERVYLAKEVPESFFYDMPGACMLANYVRQHYEPSAYGKYLVAMKRVNQ